MLLWRTMGSLRGYVGMLRAVWVPSHTPFTNRTRIVVPTGGCMYPYNRMKLMYVCTSESGIRGVRAMYVCMLESKMYNYVVQLYVRPR